MSGNQVEFRTFLCCEIVQVKGDLLRYTVLGAYEEKISQDPETRHNLLKYTVPRVYAEKVCVRYQKNTKTVS